MIAGWARAGCTVLQKIMARSTVARTIFHRFRFKDHDKNVALCCYLDRHSRPSNVVVLLLAEVAGFILQKETIVSKMEGEQVQPDGSYPRLNSAMLRSGKFNNMIVSFVGHFANSNAPDGSVSFQTSDGGSITFATEQAEVPQIGPDQPPYEAIGQVQDPGLITVSTFSYAGSTTWCLSMSFQNHHFFWSHNCLSAFRDERAF